MNKNKSEIKSENNSAGAGVNIRLVVIICLIAFTGASAVFLISELLAGSGTEFIAQQTYYAMRIFVGFFDVIVGIVFSLILLSHNRSIREMSRDNNIRGEESWRLNFAASNYSMVDFIDNMLLYEQYKTYTASLKKDKDFLFYLCKDDIDLADVALNFDNYIFLTVKIPFHVVAGKDVGGIRISRFKFSKDGKDFRFIPCAAGSNTLLLRNEASGRMELAVNLIVRKDDDFYSTDKVMEFNKIKLNLTASSLLGVAVSGWSELYFTNPRKLEKDGANIYKITSSQFKISGLPTLVQEIKSEV